MLLRTFYLWIIIFLFQSCSNDKDIPGPSKGNKISALVNGELFTTNNFSVSETNDVFSISGTSSVGTLKITLANPPQETKYIFGSPSSYIYYSEYSQASKTYSTKNYTGEIIIQTVVKSQDGLGTDQLSGTFSFTGYNGQDSIVVTEGIVEYRFR